MGKSYLIDYCIAVYRKTQEEKAYKIYVADCLRMMTESTAKFAGGTHMKARFADIIGWGGKQKRMTPEEETRTGAEIIQDIKDQLASMMGGGGEDG